MTQTLDWIPRIKDALIGLDDIPLAGNLPPFPYDKIALALQNAFEWSQTTLKAQDKRWVAPEEALRGLEGAKVIRFSLAPLEGALYLALKPGDKDKLLQWLVKSPAAKDLSGAFKDGIFAYFLIELMRSVEEAQALPGLSPQLEGESSSIDEPCFAIDVTLSLHKETIAARILLSNFLQKNLKAHTLKQASSLPSPDKLRRLDLLLHLVAGKITLPQKQWHTLRPGDLLVLDHCSYDPAAHKGSVLLTLHGKPLFRGRLKDGSLKLLESPFYYAENASMTTDDDDEDISDNMEDDEEMITDVSEEMEEENEEEEEMPEESSQTDEEKFSSIRDIPVTLTVEMARLRMTAEQVLALSPGNMLELDQPVESHVHLLANGRRIGKGELVKIGELLGVRITELS